MNKIYYKKSKIPNCALGVFAKKDIKKNETIEICPMLRLSKHNMNLIEKSILVNYVFFAGRKKNIPLLVLGYGSLYNHSENNNAKYKINLKENKITFFAIKDIKKDSEITFNYKGFGQNTKLWFE